MTPGRKSMPAGSPMRLMTLYSCCWRGLPSGSDSAPTPARRTAGRIPSRAAPGGGGCGDGLVDGLDVQLDRLDELRHRLVLEEPRPLHGQVGTIELQDEAAG